MKEILYTNEIVFRGHPDKVCDQISDALLDAYLEEDKNARCGIEVCGGKGKIFITGEVTSSANIDIEKIVKRVLRDIGYNDDYEIINNLGKQSPDIALGTNVEVQGAGDQGMMFGYATNETKEYLPKAMVILQKLSMKYDDLRKKESDIFYPDGKAQITGYYDQDMNLKRIKTFTVSYNNSEENRKYSDNKIKEIIEDILKEYDIEVEEYLINPTGKFLIGGFEGDAGLTGRKIVVDNYHSFMQVGGGAFSGKDPSKVDRTGAYKARELAVRFLKEKNLEWVKVQLSYAIGIKEPLSIYINSNKGYIEVDKSLYHECSIKNMIDDLKLLEIKYEDSAKYGHFR